MGAAELLIIVLPSLRRNARLVVCRNPHELGTMHGSAQTLFTPGQDIPNLNTEP